MADRFFPRSALFLGAALALPACGSSRNFVSPVTEQGPAPFVGPPRSEEPVVPKAPPPPTATQAPPPANLSFYKTQDSSDWVARTFKVQKKYARVIAVDPSGAAPAKVTVGLRDLNAAPGSEVKTELSVNATVKTLEDGAKVARGGDLVVVMPGRYQGFTIGDKPDAADEAYIHFKALGDPGQVIIDRATNGDPNWMILLLGAHHVIIEGFNLAGSNDAGKPPAGPNAGIMINGDFLKTSKLAHHIAVVGNFSHNHKKWGLHSVDSHTVLLQDNLFANSAMEHAAYISDGSDNYVIRRNVFFGSNASGLQCNVDPLASLEKLKEHPDLVGQLAYKQSREWALEILKRAAVRFGQHAFPDGRGFNFIIEENVINGNGKIGGGAINLAGVRESLIQNNLVYGNFSSGIVEWDNANPFDAAQVDPGPRAPTDVTGPDALPIFGCFSNVIRNNTVLMNVRARPALLVGNGSWGTRARNNVLINDGAASLEIKSTAIWRFDASRNVLGTVNYDGATAALRSLAMSLPEEPGSAVGVVSSKLMAQFEKPSEEPWVVIENGWWKPNPKRPSFRPRAGAAVLVGQGDTRELPPKDIEGKKRKTADIGAYAASE